MASNEHDQDQPDFDIPTDDPPEDEANPVSFGGAKLPPVEEAQPTTFRRSIQENSCVIIGPSKAGKTQLLLAMQQACHLQKAGEPHMDYVATDEATGDFLKTAVDLMVKENTRLEATMGLKKYHFTVSAYGRDWWTQALQLLGVGNFHANDAYGEALFPTGQADEAADLPKTRTELFEAGPHADWLIMCVDSTNPQPALLHRYMPEVISGMLAGDEVYGAVQPPRSLWNHLTKRRQPRAIRGSARKMNFKRVLLLLTKVDQLCSVPSKALSQHPEFADLLPRDLASLLDPVYLARELLGVPLLKSIHSAMRQEWQHGFAVGVSSAGGFDSKGDPFLDKDGHVFLSTTTRPEDLLSRWMPFGVRESLLFLLTGAERETVRAVDRDDLLIDETHPGSDQLIYDNSRRPRALGEDS